MSAPFRRELLTGWGRAPASAATVVRPESASDLEDLVAGERGTLPMVARGLGRSYGDAAQCAGGLVLDCTGLNHVLDLDIRGARVRAEAGVSFDELLRLLVPRGCSPLSRLGRDSSRSAARSRATYTARIITWTARSAGTWTLSESQLRAGYRVQP